MRVGVIFPSRFDDPGDFLADARAMEAAGVDSVWLDDDGGLDPIVMLAAIAAVTSELRLGMVHRPPPGQLDTLQQLSRRRMVEATEPWRRVKTPIDRDDWSRTLEDAERDGVGVLVTMAPGLLDLLRHPDDAIDRTDLVLAQG